MYGISLKYSCWFSLAKHLSAKNRFLPWNSREFWISAASSAFHSSAHVWDVFLIRSSVLSWQAVLETIRNLMNTDCVVPAWLHDIILGYGDPSSAHYSKMPNQIATLDFNDTFLSIEHLKASFPDHNVKVTVDDPALQIPPFR